jgi:hypothetical protein
MARTKREWTEAKFERYKKEGRGQGTGKDYVPWIKVQDFPSNGRSHRVPGWKTGRIHHLLSDQEKRTFYPAILILRKKRHDSLAILKNTMRIHFQKF